MSRLPGHPAPAPTVRRRRLRRPLCRALSCPQVVAARAGRSDPHTCTGECGRPLGPVRGRRGVSGRCRRVPAPLPGGHRSGVRQLPRSVPGCRFLPRSTSRFSIRSATGAGSGPWGPPPATWLSVGVRGSPRLWRPPGSMLGQLRGQGGHRPPGAVPVDVVGSVACTPAVRGQREGPATAVPLLFQEGAAGLGGVTFVRRCRRRAPSTGAWRAGRRRLG